MKRGFVLRRVAAQEFDDSIAYYENIPLDSISEDIRQMNLLRLRALLPPSDSTEVDGTEPIEGGGSDDETEGKKGGNLSATKSEEALRIEKENEKMLKKRARKEKRKEIIDGILGKDKGKGN